MATRHGAVQSLTGGSRIINPITGEATPLYASAHAEQGLQQSANRDVLPFFVPKQPGQPAYQPPVKPVRQSYEESLAKPPSQPAEHSAIVRRLADRDAKIPAKQERVIPARAPPETSIVHMHSPPPWGTTELVITSPRGRAAQASERTKHATVSSLAADNTLERQLDQIARVIESGQTTLSIDNQTPGAKRALLHMMMASSQPHYRTAQQIKHSQSHKKSSSKSKGGSGMSSRNRSKSHSRASSHMHLRRNSLPNAATVLSSSLRALSPPSHAAGQRPRGAEAVNYVKATSNAHGGERFGGLSSTVNLSHPEDFVHADVGVKKGVAAEVRSRVNRAFQQYDEPDPLSAAISSYVSRASTATHTRATTGTHTQATTGTHTQATTGTHTQATTGYHTPTEEYSGAATPRPQQSWGPGDADTADAAAEEADVSAAPIVSAHAAGGASGHLHSCDGAWANRSTPRPASAAAPASGRASGKATPRTSNGHAHGAQVQAQSQPRSGAQTPLAATLVRPLSATDASPAHSKSQSHTPRRAPSVATQQQQQQSPSLASPGPAPVTQSSSSVNRPASSSSLREQRSASKSRIAVSQDMPTAGRASHVLVPVHSSPAAAASQAMVPIQSHGPAHQGHLTAMYQSASPRGAQRPVTMASLLSPGYTRDTPVKATATPGAATVNGTTGAASGPATPAVTGARLFTSPPSAHATASAMTPTRAVASVIPSSAAPAPTTPSRQSQIDMLQSQLARLQGELRGIHSQASSGISTPARKTTSSAPGSQTARSSTGGDSGAALHPVVSLPLGGLLVSASLGNTASGFVPAQPAPKISGYGRVVSSGGMDEAYATSTAQHLDAHVMSDARPPAGTLTKKHRGRSHNTTKRRRAQRGLDCGWQTGLTLAARV